MFTIFQLHSAQSLANTELENTELLLGGEGQASGHNALISHAAHNLVLRVFLLKDTLLNMYCV